VLGLPTRVIVAKHIPLVQLAPLLIIQARSDGRRSSSKRA